MPYPHSHAIPTPLHNTLSSFYSLGTPADGIMHLSPRSRQGVSASIAADRSLLQPFWSRVSASPFEFRHRVVHGHGRDVAPCTESLDGPDFLISNTAVSVMPASTCFHFCCSHSPTCLYPPIIV